MQIGEAAALSPTAVPRRRALRVGCSAATPPVVCRAALGSDRMELAADMRLRVGGGDGQIGGFSLESEYDLAAMVSEFLENGSGGGTDSRCSSDSDSGFVDLVNIGEKVLVYKQAGDDHEAELLRTVQTLVLSIHESELSAATKGMCNGTCIHRALVHLLQFAGYDAAVCTSRWHGTDTVPGGDHEYIDVLVVNKSTADLDRLIVELDFRSHFEIARAVNSYEAILNSLPVIYVGTVTHLKLLLQAMADATKYSLEQNSMPLPPWRSLAYLEAKWESKYDRDDARAPWDPLGQASNHAQCGRHLERLKIDLRSEIDAELFRKPIVLADKKRRPGKLEQRQRRRSLLGSSSVDSFW